MDFGYAEGVFRREGFEHFSQLEEDVYTYAVVGENTAGTLSATAAGLCGLVRL
jgi:hypothetical protein